MFVLVLVLFCLVDPNEVMDMFMKWTLEIFAKTGYRDFFLLHGVTAFRALKTLLKRLDNNHIKLQALRYFWRSVLSFLQTSLISC
jgi:hypothetical protein